MKKQITSQPSKQVPQKKRRIWLYVIGAILVIGIIGNLFNPSSSRSVSTASPELLMGLNAVILLLQLLWTTNSHPLLRQLQAQHQHQPRLPRQHPLPHRLPAPRRLPSRCWQQRRNPMRGPVKRTWSMLGFQQAVPNTIPMPDAAT